MLLPQSDELEIQYLSRLFDNTSECYKFFWFQAIVAKVLEGKNVISYEELIDDMIADAWYMVTEYHLNLGPNDTLERLVNYIKSISKLKPSEKKEIIIDYLKNCDDREVEKHKRTLTRNVPYRLQAPFKDMPRGKEWNKPEAVLIERINNINEQNRLLYYFSELDGMDTRIFIREQWEQYIHKNQEILKGWLHYNIIMYLQKRNPSVPGIANKLNPPMERKLNKVKNYWKLIISIEPLHEIYNNEILTSNDISIDHFIPWSYVAHDEFWNLHPTTKSINSSKSNNLPDWKRYFPELCEIEYRSYKMMNRYDKVKKEFDKCADAHLNSMEIRDKIYKPGLTKTEFSNALKEVINPIYQSAKNCGFANWIYDGAE